MRPDRKLVKYLYDYFGQCQIRRGLVNIVYAGCPYAVLEVSENDIIFEETSRPGNKHRMFRSSKYVVEKATMSRKITGFSINLFIEHP